MDRRLKPVTDDCKTRGGLPAWVLRKHNTDDNFLDPKSGKCNVNHGTVVLRSLWWPGAYLFYNKGRI